MTNGVAYKTIVYKDADGWAVAKSNTGVILAESNTAPETVIQAALDRKGVFWWMDGTYTVSGGFTGLNIKEETAIYSSIETKVTVPQGYAGGVLVLDPVAAGASIHNVHTYGSLEVNEAGTPAEDYTGLLVKMNGVGASAPGICFCDIGPIEFNHALNGVAFDVTSVDGWCTSSVFKDLSFYYTENGVNVIQTVPAPNVGLSTVKFADLWFQAGGNTQYGFKGMIGSNLRFDNCAVWDMQYSAGATGGGHSAQFLPSCKGFLITGGIMMHHNVDNQAPPGEIRYIDRHAADSVLQYVNKSISFTPDATGQRVFTWAHSMGFAPKWVNVTPKSVDANASPIRWSWDTVNISVFFLGAVPPPGTPGNQGGVVFAYEMSVK